ncbi:MAG TPA: metallophosphoesterase [Verrucomicrobiae bacterium]|nr:metallophosphoesterase [Verrucomicrobiae bacterium]
MPLFKRHHDDESLTLYYASDIHGSDLLWRKFLGASAFYGADAAIMGGDLLGKAVVPIERRDDGTYKLTFLGAERVIGDGELAETESSIRFNGFYPWVASADEIARHRADQETLFHDVARGELQHWIEIADERANGNRPFVIAGNDDPWYVDELLSTARGIVFCDDRVVRVGPHEMISSSYANRTPWDSPRELDEDALYERLRALADQLERPETSIFNLHVPPYDSGLDRAQKLKPDLTPVYAGGQPVPIPVGSTAVRRLIEEVQPLLALHGHIHESRGETRIGRTLALNSGSEYNTGRLHGVVVRLGLDRVISHQFVVG